MIEIVPFMLFILGIPEDGRGEIEMSRHPALFETEAECRAFGERVVHARVVMEHENSTRFHIFCKRVPSGDEYDTLFDELSTKRQQPKEAQEK